jgi:Lar family restriction alleviation protein
MKLLPCPFCGGEAEIERYGDRRQSTIYACTMCGCRLETGEEWDHGADWNKRHDCKVEVAE